MLPLIRAGSVAAIRTDSGEPVGVGDIIAFRADSRTVVHRVVEVRRGEEGRTRYREKGDNNARSTWISESDLLGKAVWVADAGGRRHVDIAAGNKRVQVLTLASRLEGNLFDALTRIRERFLRLPPNRATYAAAAVLKGCLLPLKLLVGPVLLSAYRRVEPPEERALNAFVLKLFRGMHGTKTDALSLPDGLEWDDVLEALQVHGILPQSIPVLEDLLAASRIPESVVAEARKRRYHAGFTQISAVATLQDLRSALGGDGIPYLIIKGPALSFALYDDDTPRTYADIDVVVKRADRDRAIESLARGSFQVAGGRLGQQLVRAGHFHIVLEPTGKARLKVELHWSLVDRANLYRIDGNEVFPRLRIIPAGGIEIPALAVGDELVYLCLHVIKHGVLNELALANKEPPEWFCGRISANRLGWFLDIQRLLERHGAELDWPSVRAQCERWNTIDEVTQCLAILDRLLPGGHAEKALEALGHSAETVEEAGRSVMSWFYRTGLGARLIQRSMAINRDFTLRPVRLFFIGTLLFPPGRKLLRYYRKEGRGWLALLFLAHPFMFIRKQFS